MGFQLVFSCIALVLLLPSSCPGEPPASSEIEATIEVEQRIIRQGQAISVVIRLKNTSDRDLTLFNKKLDPKIERPLRINVTDADGKLVGDQLESVFKSIRFEYCDDDWAPLGRGQETAIQHRGLAIATGDLTLKPGVYRVQVAVMKRLLAPQPPPSKAIMGDVFYIPQAGRFMSRKRAEEMRETITESNVVTFKVTPRQF